VDLAKANVKTATAQYELLSQDFERMSGLYDQKALSQQQYDQIKTQKENAETGLEQARLQLDQANENYQNSFIKAPFDGVVGAVFFEQDQMVPAGLPVVQIVSPDEMKSKLQVSGKDISSISIGQPVVVKFPSITGKEYKGKVVNINQAIDPVSNLLEIEVRLLNPDKQIKSGIFGEFLIETVTKQGIIVVPENALMQRTEIAVNKKTGMQETIKKHLLYTVENGMATLKEVKTGIRSDGRIEIMEGLSSGDTVIVVGQNIVRDGQKVRIIE
jgi:RND family efflux transporter MFP subunit